MQLELECNSSLSEKTGERKSWKVDLQSCKNEKNNITLQKSLHLLLV